MAVRHRVLWSPRARERIRGLELDERQSVRRAASRFRRSGASPIDGPALSKARSLRWRLVGDFAALEYAVYLPGEHDQLPEGGFYVTLVMTEKGTVERIRRHLAETAE